MAQGELANRLLAALEEGAEAQGLDIVDVEVVGATKAPTIRVRIDRLDGQLITLDEVTEKSAWVSQVIEEIDPFENPYNLEVSSPGVDRPLRRKKDFERFVGQKCEVTTTATEGRRKFTGLIGSVDDEKVVLDVDGEETPLALNEIKKATLKAELNFKPAKKGQ